MFEGECPKCNNEIEIDFSNGDNECPSCGHGGYWDEEYNEDGDWWMLWYWDIVTLQKGVR